MALSEKNSIQLYGTESLCFDKNDFIKNGFNADTFVQIHQASGSVGLETLRDDLGIYLKILRSAMIDLINRDYADFVNLSTNLTGLDGLIESIKTPLGQLREEVLSVEKLLSEAINSISSDLERRHSINKQKSLLHRLSQIAVRLERLESLLKSRSLEMESTDNPSNEEIMQTSGNDLIDRLATEVNHLNFLVSHCEGAALLDTFRPRVEAICNFVEVGLERGLREGIQEGDKPLLVQTLRTYTSLGTIDHAHQKVGTIIKNHLEEVISDSALKSNPRDLHGVCETILDTIKKVCGPLLAVTLGSGLDIVPGFAFLEKAAWPEIVYAMDTRIQHIFNAGNPDAFHKRFQESMKFLDNFEEKLEPIGRVIAFRETTDYQKFLELWNLPVYFQIRYQEIGQVVESSLSDETDGFAPVYGTERDFQLNSTQVVWDNLVKCYNPEVFLLPLLHRFWKLSLLILSRYRTWVTASTEKLKEISLEQPKKDNTNFCSKSDSQTEDKELLSGLSRAVAVLHDIHVLSLKLEKYYENTIEISVVNLPEDKKNVMKETLSEQVEKLITLKSGLIDFIVSHLVSTCSIPLKQVTDTPRIYRRTNRPLPTSNQQYIANAIQPIIEFEELSKNVVELQEVQRVYHKLFTALTAQFHIMVYEVLSSVHKMEESLRRLKRARDRGAQSGTDSLGLPSDDDKIRTQIYLDVCYLGDQISLLVFDTSGIENYQPLLTMVQNAKDGKFVQ